MVSEHVVARIETACDALSAWWLSQLLESGPDDKKLRESAYIKIKVLRQLKPEIIKKLQEDDT